jgi:hypothetical protein
MLIPLKIPFTKSTNRTVSERYPTSSTDRFSTFGRSRRNITTVNASPESSHIDRFSTPDPPRRNIATVNVSPDSSQGFDQAANTSASLYDAAYRIEDEVDEDDGDEALIRIFDRDGEQGAEDLLGFDQDGLEDDAEEEQWDLADDGELLTDV